MSQIATNVSTSKLACTPNGDAHAMAGPSTRQQYGATWKSNGPCCAMKMYMW